MGAALAFMAANRQGKAWAMHDKLFVDDPKVKEEVEADSKQGTSLGASGTPTFFINGRQLVGAQPFDKFKEIIEDEIKKADELIKAGTPLADVYKKRTGK